MEEKAILEQSQESLEELGLTILEVEDSTVLEEMGASIGWNSCSSISIDTY